MGEIVAAMGTTAAIGGAGIAAMKVGASAVEKAGPAAARATMNRVGDASAIASAGLAGRSKTGEMGGSAKEHKLRSNKEEVAELGKQGWEAVGIEDGAILFKRPCGKIQMVEVSRENNQDVGEGGYGH